MIPYAVWGVNCFSGRLYTCNDGSVAGMTDCVGEYLSSPIDGIGGDGFLAPRTWTNPSVDARLVLCLSLLLCSWLNIVSASVVFGRSMTSEEFVYVLYLSSSFDWM